MNSVSAKRTTRLRPRSSASEEAKGRTRRAKREVHEVMTDLSSEVSGRCERDVPMETRVALITPVSSGEEDVVLVLWSLCVMFDRRGCGLVALDRGVTYSRIVDRLFRRKM